MLHSHTLHLGPSIPRRLTILAALICVVPAGVAQLDPYGGELLTQGSGGLPDLPEIDDRLGTALAAGDFNHDGSQDLAFGVPRQEVGAAALSGVVLVVYGSESGFPGGASEVWDGNDFAGVGLTAGDGDRFGSSLAAGDFDDDGYDDLAIGAPFKRVARPDGSLHDMAGTVFVLHGSPSGLGTAGQQAWRQGHGGLQGVAEAGDRLGSVLAVGDADGDGFDDLAIGVPYEDVGAIEDSGGVNVIYGSASGLSTVVSVSPVWTQDSFGFTEEAGDHFGGALAFGDFSGDGADDLAVGVPDEDLTGASTGGMIFLVRGSIGSGLTADDAETVSHNHILLPGLAAAGERFGAALTAADFDGDGLSDLAMAAPGEGWVDGAGTELVEVGAVYLLRGGAAGLLGSGVGRRILRADVGVPASLDAFGVSLAAADFDQDGTAELVAGAPGAIAGGAQGAGAAYVLSHPLQALPGVLELTQSGAAPGSPNLFDAFGSSLAVGDFDDNRFPDLAVGAPHDDPAGVNNAGSVTSFYSLGLFRDGFESGNVAVWSTAVGD